MSSSERNAEQPPVDFERSLQRLQQIVQSLEEGAIGLEESLHQFEEGIGLLRECHVLLERAEQKIELLTGQDPLGNPLTTPFDATASAEKAGQQAGKQPTRRRTVKAAEQPKATDPVLEAGPPLPDSPGGTLF